MPRPSRRDGWVALLVLAGAAAASAPARAGDDAATAAALVAALPADGLTDIVLVDQPSRPDAPRVRAVTHVAATPAGIKAVLLDPTHYRALIPSLIESNAEGNAPVVVRWELEVPIFNLSGRLAVRDQPNGVTFELFDGDFAPGRLVFTALPDARGGTALAIDAVLDIKRSSWLLRRIIKRSPAGEPAALAAAAYVALRAVALRAEHPNDRFAWRARATPAPPPEWRPDPRPLATEALAPLRAQGVLALVARQPNERLAGVAAAVVVRAAAARVAAALRDPGTWRIFPGWSTIKPRPGPNGPGADVEDNLPLVDLDATWTAEPGPISRWTATAGALQGARLGWTVFGTGADTSAAVLSLYPRLEATGTVARRFIAAEPLLEPGLALALTFVDAAATGVAFSTAR